MQPMTEPDPRLAPLGEGSATKMLRHWATDRPDAPMATADGRTVTWGEVYRRACRIAASLHDIGVRAGDRVALLDRNGIEHVETFFGCALLGAVHVAVNWRLSLDEAAGVLDDSGASVLFVGPDDVGTADGLAGRPGAVRHRVDLTGLQRWLDAHSDADAKDPGFEPEPDDVVTQLYTSGTTGLPKGAMITGRNISWILAKAARDFDVDAGTVSMVVSPLFHIGGTGWALAGMSHGGHTVLVRTVDPPEILSLVEQHGVTDTFLAPAVLRLLVAAPELATTDVSSLRTVYYGASPISESLLVRSITALGCKFAQLYGLTETAGGVTWLRPEDHDPGGPRAHLLHSAGKPFGHVELCIADPGTGGPVRTGEVGEIWVRSGQVMLGYWGKPDDTAQILTADGWLRTGDAGWLDGEGYLYLHDRLKDMIVSGGENVYPAEVENVLHGHGAVADVAVIGVPHDLWGETVKAVVVVEPGVETDPQALATELIAFTRQRLAHYKCPTSVDVVDALPRNPSGKVLKRELRAPYWARRTRTTP